MNISKEQFKDILANRLNGTVAVVYDSPNAKLSYGELYIEDPEMAYDIPDDTLICVDSVDALDIDLAVDVMHDNCEWWNDDDADRMSVISWRDNNCITYMLVYDVKL